MATCLIQGLLMDTQTICEFGRAAIETEAKMISNLIDRIDEYFAKACHFMHRCTGRIIVMGVGKSGHIAKKIAATLASTGTPAFFIHPSEAKHGDIGMITSQDVVLALSNSGETEEITALLSSLKNLQVPLISMTGKPHSALAKAAAVNLNVAVEKEACPLGLAPTSSTTAALVMGDALAVALLQMRGFTENDFARSHPGGTLGRKLLMTVEEIMHQGDAIPRVSPEMALKDALIEITHKKLGMTTIVNEKGVLEGIFTDGDLRRALDCKADIHITPISTLMTASPKTIPPSLLVTEALAVMESFKITALVVTNDQHHPIGILHIHDILRTGVA
jgi:arabinose-5-phosphate isomerase